MHLVHEDVPLVAGARSGEHGLGRGALPSRSGTARLRRVVRHCIEHEPLLLATLAGVAVGVILGTALSFANLSPTALEVIGLPGDLLMRTLKMLVLPLITASVMAGVCALRQSTADMGKVARYTLLYYFSTTMGAVVLGIAIVNIVRPGRGSPFDQLDSGEGSCHAANQKTVASHAASTGQHSPVEAFLGVIKSAFPDNVFAAAVNMNVLGIITVSLLMGAALSSMGPEAVPMITIINIFNDAIGKIVNWVIWTSPIGIASLITTSICKACNLAATLEALGLFILAVLMGLLLWGFIILPAIYYATTRRNPGQVYRGFSQAMATAFGTDSSNATLPITMRCATEGLGCDPRIVQFFLPLGTTVNMNGTALYEAVTVIFIAQAHGVVLGAAGTVIVALTATLAAVGAAGIPSAGLVTMLMVLQAVELEQYASDIAIILAVDWFLDRCRTVVNVLGDSFGTVIIDHHARGWITPAAAAAAAATAAAKGHGAAVAGGGGAGGALELAAGERLPPPPPYELAAPGVVVHGPDNDEDGDAVNGRAAANHPLAYDYTHHPYGYTQQQQHNSGQQQGQHGQDGPSHNSDQHPHLHHQQHHVGVLDRILGGMGHTGHGSEARQGLLAKRSDSLERSDEEDVAVGRGPGAATVAARGSMDLRRGGAGEGQAASALGAAAVAYGASGAWSSHGELHQRHPHGAGGAAAGSGAPTRPGSGSASGNSGSWGDVSGHFSGGEGVQQMTRSKPPLQSGAALSHGD
ncbi:hypothetical protein CHLRE_10g456400v5 [Chlamydomonas reinhardtii]|uniref:Amino acid transporter n=1 Tax=Chlamydomonas reinhardtii TaxID=3055 RepID=A0A2K3DBJ7_CHLRE|nr:uncharacterized protein CHLRE_10g456400v5 [Chlamydomonas reinhardtii]PNW77902.1 hypothetical protein CHLRE_10g456400v5 [Chlamydomonas reinhardtii]